MFLFFFLHNLIGFTCLLIKLLNNVVYNSIFSLFCFMHGHKAVCNIPNAKVKLHKEIVNKSRVNKSAV